MISLETTSIQPESSETTQLSKWNVLHDFLCKNYHKPDTQALRCVLSACRAQYSEGDPVWLFVIGPSGSGKTAIIVNSASSLPNTYVESSITTKSLLSGVIGGEKSSLLEIVQNGILIFKDFTTILSKRDEDQREIVSQFREVFDGRFSIRTGQRHAVWEGKVTVIAAVTPAIEKAWAIHRDLGERFLQVRWYNGESLKIAEYARLQRGKEKRLASEMRALTKSFFNSNLPTPQLSDDQGQRIDIMATCIARLRGSIQRDTKSREVIDAAQPEEPTRIAKALDSLVCHHAGLFGRPEATAEDFRIAQRIAFDSVASKRMRIMAKIPNEGEVQYSMLPGLTGFSEASLKYHLDELLALDVLQAKENGLGIKQISIHPNFVALWLSSREGLSA